MQVVKGSRQKRQKFHTLCEVRGVSKIWCVNLKKVVLEANSSEKTDVFWSVRFFMPNIAPEISVKLGRGGTSHKVL